MENIALSDSNDDFTGGAATGNNVFRPNPVANDEQQQHVTSELHDAANTNVTKAPLLGSMNTPFRPLFPAPTTTFGQAPPTGSPSLFQQPMSGMSTGQNPLLQPPTTGSQLSSPLIQPTIRPPSAFTPLVPTTVPSQLTSLIQPKLTLGNPSSSSSLPAASQPIQYPIPKLPPSQNFDNTILPPPPPSSASGSMMPHEKSVPPSDSHFQPLPLNTMNELNATLPAPPLPPPPPSQSSTLNPSNNPYSARASLTERIYPSMPTSQAPLQPQQLPPPTNFQPSSTGSLYVPPAAPPSMPVPSSTLPSMYPGVDPTMNPATYQAPVSQVNPDPWNNYSAPAYQQTSDEPTTNNASGIWSWISGNKMLATVVEKAKTGLETVITTVDPQMKQYIQPGHEIHIVVTSAKDVKLTPVRDAFTHVFGRVTTQGIGVQSNVAPQPVGFEAGFKGAQQRIENLRRQNVVRPDQCVVSIENFIAELVPDMYFDLGYVLLSDPLNSIELHLFTQAIPVPIEYVYQARDRTPADYPLKWSGYMVTVGEMIHAQLPFVSPEDWHEMMSGTSRRDIIYATCRSLAYMYKQRLNRKQ